MQCNNQFESEDGISNATIQNCFTELILISVSLLSVHYFFWVLHIMNLVDVNHTKGVHNTTPDAHTHGGHVCEFDWSSRAVREQMKSAASRRFLRANLNQQTNERTHKNARMGGLSPIRIRSGQPISKSCSIQEEGYPQPVGQGILNQDLPFCADLHNIFVTIFLFDNRITHCRHCLELWFARLDGALNYSCHFFSGHKMQLFKFPM